MIIVDAISESALPAIAKIEAGLFEMPLSLPALKSLFDGPAFTGLVSFANANLAGYLLAHLTQDQLEILSLGTAWQYQRQGHASLLLSVLIRNARDTACFLEVAVDNKSARDLYRGNGFVEVGTRPRYYRRTRGSCDAVVMRRG